MIFKAHNNATFSKELIGLPLLAGLLFFCVTSVFAQQETANNTDFSEVSSLIDRYPPKSINSVEIADRALNEAAKERAEIESRFESEEQACYRSFFTNACIDTAKNRRRAALAKMHPIEIEANAFKRQAKVTERDKNLVEKQAQEEQDRPKRLQQQKENESATAKKADKAKTGNTNRKDIDPAQRTKQHDAKLARIKEKEAADAQKRAENAAAYEAKVREAQEHQREVERNKKEKEKKRSNQDAAAPKP